MLKATQCLSLVVILTITALNVQLLLCFSPECSTVVIVESDNPCTKTRQSGSTITNQWQCADLQSALIMVPSINGEQRNTTNCVSIAVPAGDHLVTGPVDFGAASVYMFGSGERSEDVSISCNYTVDVDESRIFDLDYNYTDYTFYFNRSEVVSFEMVQFVGCPYPLRLDTIAAVRIHNSTFR